MSKNDKKQHLTPMISSRNFMSDKQLQNAFENVYKPNILSKRSFHKNKSVQIIHPLKGTNKSYFNTIEICVNDESDADSLSMDSDETQNVKTGYAINEESNDGSEEQSELCKIKLDDELVVMEHSEYEFDSESSSGSELEQESSPE